MARKISQKKKNSTVRSFSEHLPGGGGADADDDDGDATLTTVTRLMQHQTSLN